MTSRKIRIQDVEIGNGNQFLISESSTPSYLYSMQYGFFNSTTLKTPYVTVSGWSGLRVYTKILGYK